MASVGGAADARCAPNKAAALPRVIAAANDRRSMRAPFQSESGQASPTSHNACNPGIAGTLAAV
jgi:hypothetical protein